jgi:hypothetical protein
LQRRAFLAGTASAAFVAASARADDAGLSFGLTPVFLSNDQELLTLIRGYLEDALGTRVQLVQRRTYQEITAMLLAGQIDAAWICGYPYVRHRDDFALLAVPVWRGRALYQSYLIGRPAGDEGSLADLRGEIHAFSDPDSSSGRASSSEVRVSYPGAATTEPSGRIVGAVTMAVSGFSCRCGPRLRICRTSLAGGSISTAIKSPAAFRLCRRRPGRERGHPGNLGGESVDRHRCDGVQRIAALGG